MTANTIEQKRRLPFLSARLELVGCWTMVVFMSPSCSKTSPMHAASRLRKRIGRSRSLGVGSSLNGTVMLLIFCEISSNYWGNSALMLPALNFFGRRFVFFVQANQQAHASSDPYRRYSTCSRVRSAVLSGTT
jgi:hypothetical protein